MGGDKTRLVFTSMNVTEPRRANRAETEMKSLTSQKVFSGGAVFDIKLMSDIFKLIFKGGNKMISLSFCFVSFSSWSILITYVCVAMVGRKAGGRGGDVSPLFQKLLGRKANVVTLFILAKSIKGFRQFQLQHPSTVRLHPENLQCFVRRDAIILFILIFLQTPN